MVLVHPPCRQTEVAIRPSMGRRTRRSSVKCAKGCTSALDAPTLIPIHINQPFTFTFSGKFGFAPSLTLPNTTFPARNQGSGAHPLFGIRKTHGSTPRLFMIVAGTPLRIGPLQRVPRDPVVPSQVRWDWGRCHVRVHMPSEVRYDWIPRKWFPRTKLVVQWAKSTEVERPLGYRRLAWPRSDKTSTLQQRLKDPSSTVPVGYPNRVLVQVT